MASIKVKFRASTIEGKEGTVSVYYQIIQNRVIRQLKTDYRIFTDEWNEVGSCIIVGSSERRNLLLSLQERMEWDLKRLDMIVHQLENRKGTYTADDIIASFQNNTEGQSLFNFMQGIIRQLKQLNKIRTSETYTATLNSFMKFRCGHDILLCEIVSDTMMLYEAWLRSKGNCPNTVSFYMRILRAVYNRAVEKELVEQKHPFKHVYTGIDKTVKRAVQLKSIKRIKELDLTMKPNPDYARDMFLFSFYTRGMSFIDMAYLRKSDLKNGILTYRRKKTGQQLTVKWEKCMEEIVVKYECHSATQYLLPIIVRHTDERIQYRNALCRVNVALKEVAQLVNLSVPLTMYCARHGWASVAKSKNIPLSVISEGMGHDSEETTRIYLASLDTSLIDKANSLILKDF
ncbi:site-specific integrase [Bacteroides stercoris]|uniref:site-specific integrase n=1 Tax=Bacteroides stercoris TaxID=46506 RepID=UPI00101DFD46|nr:site-specific integrase [Bacteroides stercoris]